MSIFDIFKKKKKPEQEIKKEETATVVDPVKKSTTINQKSYSTTRDEKAGIFEYIPMKVAGTSFHQKDIEKAIQLQKEYDFFCDEKFDGMTNKVILEETYDEPIFEYSNALFSDCSLRLEPENEYDAEAIAVYIDSIMVGHIPKKGFEEAKDYIYKQLNGGLKENQNLRVSLTLSGGKYKINRGNEKVETGKSDYKLSGQVIIKTEHN